MLIEVARVRIDALGLLAMIGTPPRQRVVEDTLQLLDAQRVEHFLCALERKRVGEGANRFSDNVNDAGVVGPGVHDLGLVEVEIGHCRNGEIVLDHVGSWVFLGYGVVAMTEPQEIPASTIGRVRLLGYGLVQEVARAASEIGEERMDADVPVGIVFEDER